ncbi:MAG: phenylacetate--CoA ligase [Rhizobiales bacterium]|nr:phenylacetate--CoA ligase [Hyphomicrobiales bacterium]
MSGQSLRASPLERSEPVERASLDELRALQLGRLREALARAAQVPQYRKKFAEIRIAPGDLAHLDDLQGFPFTTKEDLRQNYPFGMFAVPMDEIARIHASSGTTGKPTVVGYTRGDIELWSALIARSIRAAGGRPGDKMHVAYGYGLFTGGLGFHYGAEHLGCTVIPVSGGFTERQVQLITDFKPDLIAVTPSYLLAIADEFDRQGIDARGSSLRIALCGAEPWTEAMRGEIERRMNLNALNVYGLSEVIGPGVAQEYGDTKDGLTIWEDHFYPEIIDPDTGAVLPDGEEGELVLTSLSKEAMPVIRYRTRDLTRLLPGNGRAMRRMDRIKGRSDDMLIIRGVNVFPSQIEAALAHEEAFAPHYVLEVTRPGRLDELEIIVETRAVVATDAAMQLAKHATHLIKSQVGVTANVRAVTPGSIERSQGKAKRVIDKRPK